MDLMALAASISEKAEAPVRAERPTSDSSHIMEPTLSLKETACGKLNMTLLGYTDFCKKMEQRNSKNTIKEKMKGLTANYSSAIKFAVKFLELVQSGKLVIEKSIHRDFYREDSVSIKMRIKRKSGSSIEDISTTCTTPEGLLNVLKQIEAISKVYDVYAGFLSLEINVCTKDFGRLEILTGLAIGEFRICMDTLGVHKLDEVIRHSREGLDEFCSWLSEYTCYEQFVPINGIKVYHSMSANELTPRERAALHIKELCDMFEKIYMVVVNSYDDTLQCYRRTFETACCKALQVDGLANVYEEFKELCSMSREDILNCCSIELIEGKGSYSSTGSSVDIHRFKGRITAKFMKYEFTNWYDMSDRAFND